MMVFRYAWIAVAISVMAMPAFAQQRPLVTEDPETVGANRVLVEGGVEFDKDQFYSAYGLTGDTTHGPTFGVSAGLSPNAEIQVDGGLLQRLDVTARRSAPLSAVLDFTGDHATSLEDLMVATKIRLSTETETRPSFGVRFGTKVPTAKRERGMGLGTTDFFAAMLVAKTVQSVRTVGNVSLLVLGTPAPCAACLANVTLLAGSPGSVRALGFGLSVARAITNEFEAVGEVNGHLKPFGTTVPPGLDSRGVLRFALRYTHQLLRFDFGVLAGVTSRDPAFGVSAGATYVIGR
jgi:hypothetical protein